MKTIHHVLDIEADAGIVWTALTQQDRMAGWWSTDVATPEAAVGARVAWTFAGDFNPVMEITEIVEERVLRWRCASGHDPWQDSEFRFELLRLEGENTRLRFWQGYAVEPPDDDYGAYNFNWGFYLESLRLFCAEGTGKPFRVTF